MYWALTAHLAVCRAHTCLIPGSPPTALEGRSHCLPHPDKGACPRPQRKWGAEPRCKPGLSDFKCALAVAVQTPTLPRKTRPQWMPPQTLPSPGGSSSFYAHQPFFLDLQGSSIFHSLRLRFPQLPCPCPASS